MIKECILGGGEVVKTLIISSTLKKNRHGNGRTERVYK